MLVPGQEHSLAEEAGVCCHDECIQECLNVNICCPADVFMMNYPDRAELDPLLSRWLGHDSHQHHYNHCRIPEGSRRIWRQIPGLWGLMEVRTGNLMSFYNSPSCWCLSLIAWNLSRSSSEPDVWGHLLYILPALCGPHRGSSGP